MVICVTWGCVDTEYSVRDHPDLLELVPREHGSTPPLVWNQPGRVDRPPPQDTERPTRFEPDIRVKSQWDTRPPNRARLVYMGKITCITVHHEGRPSANNEISEYGVKRLLLLTRKVHERVMGAGDIGYHFAIDRAGRVWEARPMKYQGAHAGNPAANRGNIGIEVMGNFNKQRVNQAQKTALAWLLNRLMDDYGLDTTDIHTHREIKKKFGLSATDCPGRDLQNWVNAFRRAACQ